MAELVSANTHTRDNMVLRNVMLAYWTWSVPREKGEGEKGKGGRREGGIGREGGRDG